MRTNIRRTMAAKQKKRPGNAGESAMIVNDVVVW